MESTNMAHNAVQYMSNIPHCCNH